MRTICTERIFCSFEALRLLLDLVVRNFRERVVGSCLDLITAIDPDVLCCLYDVVFRSVIVPHEGLGGGVPAARGFCRAGNRSP